jgi:DNA repair photolyase
MLPGISDRPEQLAEVVKAARAAGATGVWTNLLFLRPGTREHFLEHLAEDWPELVPTTRSSIRGALPRGRRIEARAATGLGVRTRVFGVSDRRVSPVEPAQKPEQLSLAV